MLGCLLALSLAASGDARPLTVYPLRHPEGRELQALALQRLIESTLEARAAAVTPGERDRFADCGDEPCLAERAQKHPGQGAVVASWTRFGDGAVLTALVLDDRPGKGTFTLARPVKLDAELPEAAASLAENIGDRLELPPPRSVPHEPERNSFGLALKVGNTLGGVAPDAPAVSKVNLRFALEGDYLAAPEFWPFVDLSLVLARDANGQRIQLVPVLLGAKYVFRKGKRVRPFAGMALGLSFLSAPLDKDTGATSTFAVYGVGGVDWFVMENVAVLAETSLNLAGVEASTGSGVLFAVGLNAGAVVLF